MKILVHGLLKSQRSEMLRRYKRSVDLVFTDNLKAKINNLPDRSAVAIVVTKFASHRHTQQIKERFVRTITLPIGAGASGVAKAIDNLLKENT